MLMSCSATVASRWPGRAAPSPPARSRRAGGSRASSAKWFMSLEMSSKRRARQAAEDTRRGPCGEPLAALPVAAADGQADDPRAGAQPGEERQLDLDGVLLLVGGGVELQARDRVGERRGRGPGRRRAWPRGSTRRRAATTAQLDAEPRVLRAEDEHEARGSPAG